MKHSPLDQFKIKEIANIELFGHEIVFTNSALFMIIASLFIVFYFILAFKGKNLIPTRLQVSGELFYSLITDTVNQNVGTKGKKFVPLIFTLFMFIMTCNLFGMIPYGFTVTSHISVTFALAMMVFLLVTLLGFALHGFHFFSLFLPKGTPWWLAPLMIIIELFTYLARPEKNMESMMALKFIGAGLMAFGMLGAAIGVGNIFGSLLNSIARNPSAADQLQRMAFIGAGLAEAMVYMPQFDISGFSTQLLWLTFVFGVLYIIVSNFIAPKAESILINRNLYLEDNIASSENDHNKALSLQKQKEEKLRELDIAIEEMQKDALNKLDAYFTKKNNQLESSLAAKTQKSFAEIQNYLHSFHENEDQSCIDLVAFIIENITDKSANIELLKKIYGTK
ncbi:unnamed protein product [Rotaria magnacalcarata]|uniref:ATPase protein 9 n=1 Tax=Rotaria magnacalcarata TaxID=392030 RepID=A0A819AVM8_9BILA|nr:unnamed protein product [Rotaria magnacalcarata]